jgi:hypothetical protein
MGLKARITAFIVIAEGIATLWDIIPFIIVLFQQQSDPTNPKYIVDMANLIPGFITGQIPGMLISGLVQAIYELLRRAS